MKCVACRGKGYTIVLIKENKWFSTTKRKICQKCGGTGRRIK